MSIGAALEKARTIPVTSSSEVVTETSQETNTVAVEAEAMPNKVGLLFQEYQNLIVLAKQNSVDNERTKTARAHFLNLFAHTDATLISEEELTKLRQSVDNLRTVISGPLVLTPQQRIMPVEVVSGEVAVAKEEVDFSNLESRNQYFDELGQQVLQLRALANTYFTRFKSADIPWPEYNKIGLQKTALAEAFFKGNFTNQFNRLATTIDTHADANITTLVDNLKRSYDLVEDQIEAVTIQLRNAQEAIDNSIEPVVLSEPVELTRPSGIDQTALRNAARAAFAKAGISPAEAERRIQKSFDAAFIEFKDDPVRLQADINRIIDTLIAEWGDEHRFDTATAVPIVESAPESIVPDFNYETTRTELYEGLLNKIAETKADALSIFETVDVAYSLREVHDFKRIGRSHVKQLDFFETQFKKLFALLPESTDIPTTIHRLNVTYAEIERHIDAIRTYVGRIIEARRTFVSAHNPDGEVVAISEVPLEMSAAIVHFNQSKILLAERLQYFTGQANRFGFSLANSRPYLDVMAKQSILEDISSYQDSDSEVSKNILKRYQQKLDQLFTAVDTLEIELHTAVSSQSVPPIDAENTHAADAESVSKHDAEGVNFSGTLPQETPIKTEPMAEHLESDETDQIIFVAETKLRSIQFISNEEKETVNFFLASYKNAKTRGASAEALLTAAKNVQDTIDSLRQTSDANYLRERAGQIKQFVQTAGKINFEAVSTITAMYENFVRIADAQAALGTPDHDNVRSAYFSLERMVTDSSSQGYQGYKELDMRPLHEEWRAAKHEHEWRSKIYEENLQLHYLALQNRQFGFAKLQYLTQKAFSIKPELPPALLQERDDSFAATARYSRLALEMREKKSEDTPRASEVQERYKTLLARTLVVNTFQTQLELQKNALTYDEKAPVSRVAQLLRDNRKAVSMLGAAVIGGVTGGLVGGAATVFRVLGSGAASAFSAKYVGIAFDKKIAASELLSDDEFAQSIEAIEQMLARQSLTQEELVGIHDALSAIYNRVDVIKRKKVIAIIGTAMIVGAGVGFGLGTAAAAALGPLSVPNAAEISAGARVSETPPTVFDTAPLQPNVPSVPPTTIFTTVDSVPVQSVIPETSPAVSETAQVQSDGLAIPSTPIFTSVYGSGAEDIPLDPGINLPQPNTVSPEIGLASDVVLEPVQEAVVPIPIESMPRVTHILVPNDNFTRLMKLYGTDLLSTLSPTEQDAVIGELAARVNQSPELLTAAGIESGNVNLLFASSGTDIHSITMDPLLAELQVVVAEKITTDLGVGIEATPDVVKSMSYDTAVPAEVVVPVSSEAVPLLQHRIAQFTDNYPGGQRAFADNFSTWVDSIQGVHPGVFSRIFMGSGVEHADAFTTLKEMPVQKMRELSNLTEAARTARLGQADWNILPADFNKWSMLIRKWSMIPGLITDDTVTLDTLAKRAYAESMLS